MGFTTSQLSLYLECAVSPMKKTQKGSRAKVESYAEPLKHGSDAWHW
jgi:hypothetical protein